MAQLGGAVGFKVTIEETKQTAPVVKIGDVVHVRARVRGISRHKTLLWVGPGDKNQMTVAADEVVHVEPRALQVGDRVTWGTGDTDFTIVALDDELAWLKSASGEHRSTKHVSNLRRA